MTTTGTFAFELDNGGIVTEAWERVGVQPGDLTAWHSTTARISMSLMFAEWSNRGIDAWAVDEITLDLVEGTISYTLTDGTIDVLDAVLRRDDIDTPIVRISRSDYHVIPDKNVKGRPDRIFVDRQATGLVMHVWQNPENSTDDIVYWRLRRLHDVGTAQNTADAPWRWHEAICSGLAFKLFNKLPLKERDPEVYRQLKGQMDEGFYHPKTEDRDLASSSFIPNTWGSDL